LERKYLQHAHCSSLQYSLSNVKYFFIVVNFYEFAKSIWLCSNLYSRRYYAIQSNESIKFKYEKLTEVNKLLVLSGLWIIVIMIRYNRNRINSFVEVVSSKCLSCGLKFLCIYFSTSFSNIVSDFSVISLLWIIIQLLLLRWPE